MRLNFSNILHDIDEAEVLTDEKKRPLTLGMAVADALVRAPCAEIAEAERAYDLALLICKGGIVEVKAEDVVLMKSKLVHRFAPLISGQACKLLERNEEVTA